jgi:hypothetical protein
MKLPKLQSGLIKIVAEEAKENPEFRDELIKALGLVPSAEPQPGKEAKTVKRGKRNQALFNPEDIYSGGETVLRNLLKELDLSQLLDIVSQHSIDSRQVMRWKNSDKIIERIVTLSVSRVEKGGIFNKTPNDSGSSDEDKPPLEHRN